MHAYNFAVVEIRLGHSVRLIYSIFFLSSETIDEFTYNERKWNP